MSQILNINLPADTLYVSGSVNGIEKTWTLLEGNTWQTVADKAPDGVYKVELTIINATGTANEESITLYYGLSLITDRTQADVQRVKQLQRKYNDGTITQAEREEYLDGMKGAYNASDFNRVGAAMEYVARRLYENGYGFGLEVKKDWTKEDIPTAENTAYYLKAISTLRSWFVTYKTTPKTPESLQKLSYIEANNIEQILLDLDLLISKMLMFQIYAGEVYAGEV